MEKSGAQPNSITICGSRRQRHEIALIGNMLQMLDQTGLLLPLDHLGEKLAEGLSRSPEIG
jgi:hypothetical protein